MIDQFKSLTDSALRTFYIKNEDKRYSQIEYYWDVTDAVNQPIRLSDTITLNFKSPLTQEYTARVLNKFFDYNNFQDLYEDAQEITDSIAGENVHDKDVIHDITAKLIISFETILREQQTRTIVPI